jgi:hypothetical protein
VCSTRGCAHRRAAVAAAPTPHPAGYVAPSRTRRSERSVHGTRPTPRSARRPMPYIAGLGTRRYRPTRSAKRRAIVCRSTRPPRRRTPQKTSPDRRLAAADMTPTRHVPGSIALGTRLEHCTEVLPPRPGPGLERSPDPWARLAKRTAGVPPSPTARSDVLSPARRPPTRHHLECRPSPEPARLAPRRNLPHPRRSESRGATARSGFVSWSVDPRSRETVNHRAVCFLSSTSRCRPIAPRCCSCSVELRRTPLGVFAFEALLRRRVRSPSPCFQKRRPLSFHGFCSPPRRSARAADCRSSRSPDALMCKRLPDIWQMTSRRLPRLQVCPTGT